MSNFGIPCPRVLLLKKHVLLLEFLGKNQVAAPKLKDAHLDTVEMQMAYEQVVQVGVLCSLFLLNLMNVGIALFILVFLDCQGMAFMVESIIRARVL